MRTTILLFVVCFALVTSALCQSTNDARPTSAQATRQAKEQQLRTALEQMRDARPGVMS